MILSRIPKYQLEASTQFNQVCKIKCSGLKVTYSLIMNLLTGTFQALFTWESRGHEKFNMLNNLSICRISTMYFDVGSLILKEDLMMPFLLYCYLHLRVLTFSPMPLLRFWGWMTVASKEISQETQWEASHCAEAQVPESKSGAGKGKLSCPWVTVWEQWSRDLKVKPEDHIPGERWGRKWKNMKPGKNSKD